MRKYFGLGAFCGNGGPAHCIKTKLDNNDQEARRALISLFFVHPWTRMMGRGGSDPSLLVICRSSPRALFALCKKLSVFEKTISGKHARSTCARNDYVLFGGIPCPISSDKARVLACPPIFVPSSLFFAISFPSRSPRLLTSLRLFPPLIL